MPWNQEQQRGEKRGVGKDAQREERERGFGIRALQGAAAIAIESEKEHGGGERGGVEAEDAGAFRSGYEHKRGGRCGDSDGHEGDGRPALELRRVLPGMNGGAVEPAERGEERNETKEIRMRRR